jgi:hypothetical protein
LLGSRAAPPSVDKLIASFVLREPRKIVTALDSELLFALAYFGKSGLISLSTV